MRFCQLQKFGALLDPYLVWMLEVVDELLGGGVAIFRIALQSAVKDLLQLGGDGRIGDARRKGMIQQPVVHGGHRRWGR